MSVADNIPQPGLPNQSSLAQVTVMIKNARNLDIEIRNLSARVKQLREQKKRIVNDILQFMNDNNIPAFNYNDSLIHADIRTRTKPKTKNEILDDVTNELRKAGIRDPSRMAQDILTKMKSGVKTNIQCLKIKNNLSL
jgi:hypothetical protein